MRRPEPVRSILVAAASIALGAVAACAGGRAPPRGDAPAAPTSRCSFEEGFPGTGLAWTGSGAPLARRGPPDHPASRLVVDARDADGASTEFLVDTGTSCAFLSDRAPAAARVAGTGRPLRLLANEGVTAFDGRDATLPRVDLGGLAARDVPVFLVDRVHDLHHPANVIGMAWMAALALDHDATRDAWSLRRSVATPAGRRVALEGPGFPVVTVVDDAGRRVFALVDTGAPTSLVERGARPGRFRLLDDAGATLLTIDARREAPWFELAPRGRRITVWIGLDDLARASWTLDFATAAWTFR